jgi:leucyl/phenylalanyl-tRNA---protein transferase
MRTTVPELALRGPLRLSKAALRSFFRTFGTTMLRCVVKVVDPATVGWWAACVASEPEKAATEMARRVGSLITPTAPEVVANYSRGLLLSGRAASCDTVFEWLTPPVRAVITRETAKVPKSLRAVQRRGEFEVRYDQDFEAIIHHCQEGRAGWLTPALVDVYREVHRLGFIATVGTYRDGKLVGGIWGIEIGRALGLLSMFHLENNGGTLAMAAVADAVSGGGRWVVADCVDLNPHLMRYGFSEISARQFSDLVWRSMKLPMPSGNSLFTGGNPANHSGNPLVGAAKVTE